MMIFTWLIFIVAAIWFGKYALDQKNDVFEALKKNAVLIIVAALFVWLSVASKVRQNNITFPPESTPGLIAQQGDSWPLPTELIGQTKYEETHHEKV